MLFEAGDIVSERYEIECQIGEGAFGHVYRARHMLLHTQVAIKVLSNQMRTQHEISERFLREAQSIASIDHPNVCRVLDFGQLGDDFDGAFFMVMEFLQGEPLNVFLEAHGWLKPSEAMDIVSQVCRALVHVHDAGIVHRDIKPENLMLTHLDDQRLVKLVDFGIAGILDPEEVEFPTAKLTRQGSVFGTPTYMSPEQAVSGKVDHRTDLYAVGCMFFEMLTGQPPFVERDVTALLLQHVGEAIPNIQTVAPKPLPASLQQLIEALLAKSPDQRPANAQAVLDRLGEIELNETDHATLVDVQPSDPLNILEPTIQSTAPPKSSMPLIAVVFGVVGLLFLVVLVAILMSFGEDPEESINPNKESTQAKTQRKTLAESRQSFESNPKIKSALQHIEQGDAKKGITQLLRHRPDFISNPHMHFALGKAYLKLKQRPEAVDALATAISLEPGYWHDDVTSRAFEDCLSSRSCTKDLRLVHASLTKTPTLKTRWIAFLADSAKTHKKRRGRREAFDILHGKTWLTTLPPLEQLTLKLLNETGCHRKLKHIEAIKKLNDSSALPTLKRVSKYPKRGCGFLNRSDCYACLRKPVKEAINALK